MLDSVLDNTDVLITDYYVNSVSKEWSESFFILDNYDFNKEEHIELIKNCFLKTSFSNYHAITMVGVPWAKMFRTDVIKENSIIYDKSLRKMQDALFCSEVFENCNNLIYRNFPTYHYRQNSNSVAHKGNKNYLNVAESILKALDKFIIKYNYVEELRSIYYARKFIFACEAVKFIYILDDTGMSFFEKRFRIKKLMSNLELDKHENEMLPYIRKHIIAFILHKMHLYGLMYLSMKLYYSCKMRRIT